MKNLLWIKDVFGDYPLVGDMKENNFWKKRYSHQLIDEREVIDKKWDQLISSCTNETEKRFRESDKQRDLRVNEYLINKTKEEIKTTEKWIEEMENAE